MNYVAFQSVLWIAAGFLLVILVMRRLSAPPGERPGITRRNLGRN